MTYRIEQFVRKIKSPVIVKIGENCSQYVDGKSLAEAEFSEQMSIIKISAKDNKVIIELVKNDRVNDVNWIGEEQAGFF